MEDSTLAPFGEINLPPSICEDFRHNTQRKRQLIFGPPENYQGPRPPIACELYITNLPVTLDVSAFLIWLNHLGDVYEMRIMMNSVSETRGYCFVRFFEKRAAVAAFELLSFLFLGGKRPNAQISQCKRQLFVGGLPRTLSTMDVRDSFKKLFETVTNCVVYPKTEYANGIKNRGFAFLEFTEHDAALEAKKFLKYHRLWGQFIKVDWARPNEANESVVPRMETSGDLRKNDYSAKLRLYALANNWCIPIVVYGSNFRQLEVQYGGVLLKDARTGNYSYIVVEVVGVVYNIHVLLCEVAAHLVEVFCGLPQKHFIIRTRYGSTAKILHSFTETPTLTESSFFSNCLICGPAVLKLMLSLEILAQFQSEVILSEYKLSFRSECAAIERIAKICLIKDYEFSYFYSIYPKYRDNYPLNNNFNDTEIVLLQAIATSNNNAFIPYEIFNTLLTTKIPDEGAFLLKSQRYNRHPNYILNYVDVELLQTCGFYNPTQQLNTPPLWVRGETYQSSIFELS